jgi:hypothetical protein
MKDRKTLLVENAILESKLALAEKWMQREVQGAITHIQKQKKIKNSRMYFENVFEADGINIITQSITDIFWWNLEYAPKYTLERLIDAEIYWYTLQKYPKMDALPVVLAYQKIFDAWIHETLILPWKMHKKASLLEGRFISSNAIGIEKDLQNILEKNYTLSVWRLYQILEIARSSEWDSEFWYLMHDILGFWEKNIPSLFVFLKSREFFSNFSLLISLEVFTKKRHEMKVNYKEAMTTREIILWKKDDYWLFYKLFSPKER